MQGFRNKSLFASPQSLLVPVAPQHESDLLPALLVLAADFAFATSCHFHKLSLKVK
jgi:hypothetical protein